MIFPNWSKLLLVALAFPAIFVIVYILLFFIGAKLDCLAANFLVLCVFIASGISFASIKFNRKVLFLIVCFEAFVALHFIVLEILRAITSFIARNYTGSYNSDWNWRFEWDLNLQITMYSLYAVFFLGVIAFTVFVRNFKSSKVRVLSVIIFILSFPTLTPWSIYCIGGCSGPNNYWLITPVIIAQHYISILVGLGMAGLLFFFR